MNWLRCLLVLSLAIGTLFAAPNAHAITSCSAEMTALNFNSADPADGTATATITYECGSYFAPANVAVGLCFAIGQGSAVPGLVRSGAIRVDVLLLRGAWLRPPGAVGWIAVVYGTLASAHAVCVTARVLRETRHTAQVRHALRCRAWRRSIAVWIRLPVGMKPPRLSAS